jgi:hypothetical protein
MNIRQVLGGESFVALAEGLQNALWALGGVPEQHRSESLPAAFRNLDCNAQEDLMRRYEELCAPYGMTPTRNNPGLAHESGTIESAYGHLKKVLGHELLLRGSGDLADLGACRCFVDEVVGRRNARNRKRIEIERTALKALPAWRTPDYEEACVLLSGLNAAPYLAARRPLQGSSKRAHLVDCCHVIHALRKKPMPLLNLVYRDRLFLSGGGLNPCRRATSDTFSPGVRLARTMRDLSSLDYRQRRPPPVISSFTPDTNHRVNGRVRLAFKIMHKGMVESIAQGLALSHQPCRSEMWGRRKGCSLDRRLLGRTIMNAFPASDFLALCRGQSRGLRCSVECRATDKFVYWQSANPLAIRHGTDKWGQHFLPRAMRISSICICVRTVCRRRGRW